MVKLVVTKETIVHNPKKKWMTTGKLFFLCLFVSFDGNVDPFTKSDELRLI